MKSDWKRRFTWIDLEEVSTVFHKEPFPRRGHRRDLGPLHLSIARCGVINPIIARVKEGKLQVICGYRRWLAAQVAGITEIPVVVTNLSDEDATQLFNEEGGFRGTHQDVAPTDVEEREESIAENIAQSIQEDADATSMASERQVVSSEIKATVETEVSRPPLIVEDREDTGARAADSIQQIHDAALEMFRETRETRKVPVQLVHELVEKLSVLDPVGRGVDIRDVGITSDTDRNPGDICEFLAAHGLRVAMLAQVYGLSCQWSGQKLLHLMRAGLTHDVGMLFVPTDWFDSPFPLTRDRKVAIQKHAEIGQQVLQESGDPLADVATVARDHHERVDGTGYPSAKRGKALGEFPQILGLLDSYAAMICPRSYRQPYLLGEALNVLRETGKVGIFTTDLVRTFFNVFSSWPIGACGRLVDGAVMRVTRVDRESAKTHLARVITSGTRFRQGEELWLRESELPSMATEVAPPEVETASGGRSSAVLSST